MKHFGTIALILILLPAPIIAVPPEEGDPASEEDQGLLDHVRRMYDRAKETGEKVPEDVFQWAKEDLASIGDWEYKLLSLRKIAPAAVEKELNELGAERWECFWVQDRDDGLLFYFRRPSRSYLKTVPLTDMLKLLPLAGSGDGGKGS